MTSHSKTTKFKPGTNGRMKKIVDLDRLTFTVLDNYAAKTPQRNLKRFCEKILLEKAKEIAEQEKINVLHLL